MLAALAAACAACAVLVVLAPRPAVPGSAAAVTPSLGRVGEVDTADDGPLRRHRRWWASGAGSGAAVLVGGPLGPVVGAAVALGVWVLAGRIEPRGRRLARAAVARDLPYVVTLLAAALRAGAAPADAIEEVARALPGAAADRLLDVARMLRLGTDAAAVWATVASDDALGPLGRCLARTHRSGAPVAEAVERLGADLARRARSDVEDAARAIGVRAAVPLGVCLLPAFVVLGIVPVAVSLAQGLV